MEQEYTVSTGFKIFYGVIAIFLLGFSIFLFSMGEGKADTPLIYSIPILSLISSILLIITQVKRKVIISDQSIIKVNAFSRKELLFSAIKGVRVGQKAIQIEPFSASDPKISIGNYLDYKDSGEMRKWLEEHFTDIDKADLDEQQNKLLADQSLGITVQDREAKLTNARKIAMAYNIVGIILGFSMIFCRDNMVTFFVLLLFPLLGIVIMALSGGLIKLLSNKKRSPLPWIMLGFEMPAIIVLFKSMGDYDLYEYNNIWLPFLMFALVIVVLLYVTGINKTMEAIKVQVVVMCIFGLIYGYGCTIQINCVFDNSEPKPIKALILKEWITYNKGKHYNITLRPQDYGQKRLNVEVSHSYYESQMVGNAITLNLKKGTLNIPWFYIVK